VVVPEKVSKEARAALETFAEQTGPAPRLDLEQRAASGKGARRA
jgi:hypothetical protein